MKALLLGCGEMGVEALKDLYRYGRLDEIVVGTRTPGKASDVLKNLPPRSTRVTAVAVDAADEDALISLMKASGSGKGTVARIVAERLGWHLLDSGALYRLTAFAGAERGLEPADEAGHAAVGAVLDVRFEVNAEGRERVLLGGRDVTRELRAETTGNMASVVAAMPSVRTALLQRQRDFAAEPGLVADGRDMGTVVFPDAQLKIVLTASPEARAMRRHKQLKEKGIDVSLPDLSWDIAQRDARDANRAVAPYKPAHDARVIDSTSLTPEEVVAHILLWLRDGAR